jgi:hypothetical protein
MSESRRAPVDVGGLPPCVRKVHPPLPVWVAVAKLFPKSPHEDYSNDPTGLNLEHEVLGMLTERIWRADGGWLGRVRIELHTRDQQWTLGPWIALVPAHLLRYHRRGLEYRSKPGGLGH